MNKRTVVVLDCTGSVMGMFGKVHIVSRIIVSPFVRTAVVQDVFRDSFSRDELERFGIVDAEFRIFLRDIVSLKTYFLKEREYIPSERMPWRCRRDCAGLRDIIYKHENNFF